MKKEDLNQKRVFDSGPDHHKAAAYLTCTHSVLNNSQNHSSSLQKELFYFNTRNCSLFSTIPLPSVGKEMALSLSESAERNSSAAAPWKDSFHLRFSSGKDSLDRVSHCTESISVMAWLEEACSFAGDFSFCCPGDNFVFFAHFWLGNSGCNKNLQFLELEMSSSKENESRLTFLKELELGGLADVSSVAVASLNEYILELLNHQKPWMLAQLRREVQDSEDEMPVISVMGRNVGNFKPYLSAENKVAHKHNRASPTECLNFVVLETSSVQLDSLAWKILCSAVHHPGMTNLGSHRYIQQKLATKPLILREELHSIDFSNKQLAAYENVQDLPSAHVLKCKDIDPNLLRVWKQE